MSGRLAAPAAQALKRWKGETVADRLMQPVGGLEAEFSLLVDGRLVRPEHVFGDPRGFLTVPLLHRTGRSFQLPSGAAVYFDTGVIEIATPVMELTRGCFGRLARSLFEAVSSVRSGLDAWERRSGHRARLQGFSTHYNVSVYERDRSRDHAGRVGALAWLLAHVLPVPVMLLATNRRSTGVGVRPRSRRLEVTADFPPDPQRLAATGAVIAGMVRAASRWRDLRVASLARRGIPVVAGFRPMRHTSRRGWLARFDCYPDNPFTCAPDTDVWATSLGHRSLRQMGARSFEVFSEAIRRMADPASFQLARQILSGRSQSWLDATERPAAYDDVGRGAPVSMPLQRLGRARYEQVMRYAVQRRSLVLGAERWTAVGVRGWSRVVFRRGSDGAETILPIDTLVDHLDDWE